MQRSRCGSGLHPPLRGRDLDRDAFDGTERRVSYDRPSADSRRDPDAKSMIGSRVDPGDEDLEGRRSRNDTKCDFDLTSCCRSFAADRAESPILPYLTDERTAVDDPLLHKGGLRDFVANGRRVQIPPIGEILETNPLGDRSSRPIDRQCASFLKAAVDEGLL